jgi:hypothetical protein
MFSCFCCLVERLGLCNPSSFTETDEIEVSMSSSQLLKLDAMRVRVAAYLTNEWSGGWTVGQSYDARVSSSTSVMTCSFSLNQDTDGLHGRDVNSTGTSSNFKGMDIQPSSIGIQEAWVSIGGMEHGNYYIQPLIWLCDCNGRKYSITEVCDESSIDDYLRRYLPTLETINAHKRIQLQKKMADEQVAVAVDESVCEEDIRALVCKVMSAGADRLGSVNVSCLREKFQVKIEEVLRKSVQDYQFI